MSNADVEGRNIPKSIYKRGAMSKSCRSRKTNALEYPNWVVSLQVELAQFDRNKVQRLIHKPEDVFVVGLKWFIKNKVDKEGNVVRNKERLLVKGDCQ